MAASNKGQARRKQKVIGEIQPQHKEFILCFYLEVQKSPNWGKETIKIFIRKNITLGTYYLLQVFTSHCVSDVFQYVPTYSLSSFYLLADQTSRSKCQCRSVAVGCSVYKEVSLTCTARIDLQFELL